MTALPTTAASLNTHFGALLAAVRAIRPKCPDCGHPLDDSGLDVRTRENDAGLQERVCRPCFQGEIAGMQLAHPLR